MISRDFIRENLKPIEWSTEPHLWCQTKHSLGTRGNSTIIISEPVKEGGLFFAVIDHQLVAEGESFDAVRAAVDEFYIDKTLEYINH